MRGRGDGGGEPRHVRWPVVLGGAAVGMVAAVAVLVAVRRAGPVDAVEPEELRAVVDPGSAA